MGIGIALGSMIINFLLAGRITLQYVPHAMLLLSLFTVDLSWASPMVVEGASLQSLVIFFSKINHWRIAIDLFLLAVSGGIFAVPLYTYLQVACDSNVRARTIAANNIMNALFMVVGTCLVMLLLHFNVEIIHVFLVMAILNVFVAFVFWKLFPKAS